eukprot:scaffold42443_cov33-Tisochrysis_lutea.AAC.2
MYPTELNPFAESVPRSPPRPQSPGLVTGSGGADAEQGSTGDAEGPSIVPGRTQRSVVHAVRQEAARRAFALRRVAALRLAWHGWRSAHTNSRILKNMQAAVVATRHAPTSPTVTASALAVAKTEAEAHGCHLGFKISMGCLNPELQFCEDLIHEQALRHAQQCSGFWRQMAAWRHALIRQRERSLIRLCFHAWRAEHKHARQMTQVSKLAASLVELAGNGEKGSAPNSTKGEQSNDVSREHH